MISLLGKLFRLMDKYKVLVATSMTSIGIVMLVMILWERLDLPLWSVFVPIGVAASCYSLLIIVGLGVFCIGITGNNEGSNY